MGSRSPNRKGVRVVLIETQYVKTDMTTFKSVVQSLTGKDSTTILSSESTTTTTNNKKRKRPTTTSSSLGDDPSMKNRMRYNVVGDATIDGRLTMLALARSV
ncbi:hypothetical protein F8388_000068 [Cannabis sativa]|uniref:VQ domain-containing protein n=1 Tax=Cannabis sativa TaxID=3483 RepID=A0A7J6GT48_CANSA|nr:hypothetical protein F8388_000068 [Cannabis sativa]KAF4386075.1 hypothetical protein G4B88_031210 [Cannabis sativa]